VSALNEIITLEVERAVAGGRMLARHGGRVVFVAGAIPGEQVRARVTKASRQSLWADTVEVITPSPDRRDPICDPACGGLAFAHINYSRQLALKGQILSDAFRRLARVELQPPPVAGSPEAHYRMRSRLHVAGGRTGFFLEGTHKLCDAGPTLQLAPESLDAAADVLSALGSSAANCEAVTISENVAGTERVLLLEPRAGARLDGALEGLAAQFAGGNRRVTGVATLLQGRLKGIWGNEMVCDTGARLLGAGAGFDGIEWRRRPTSFFQGNRFLLGHLVSRVLALTSGDLIADLYAGVGLFTAPLASRGSDVLAAEGDPSSLDDLAANTEAWDTKVRIAKGAVEDVLKRPPMPPPDAVIVDPPRTGMSAEALDRLAAWGTPSLVYVSCDPATLARDASRLAHHGFRLLSIEGLDLFPNTPHVEAIAAFVRP